MGLHVRKLAALDLHFLGPGLILTEFALGVVGSLVLGGMTLRGALLKGWPLRQTVFGAYLLSLGINYVPLLLHAVGLVRTGMASREIADEVANSGAAFRKYRRQSLYLLIPLAVPLFALLQRRADLSPHVRTLISIVQIQRNSSKVISVQSRPPDHDAN